MFIHRLAAVWLAAATLLGCGANNPATNEVPEEAEPAVETAPPPEDADF